MMKKVNRIKMKDKTNLDRLKDFGFEQIVYSDDNKCWFKKVYMANSNDDRVCYRIDPKDRIIQVTRLDGELDDTLYQLFQANLVESGE